MRKYMGPTADRHPATPSGVLQRSRREETSYLTPLGKSRTVQEKVGGVIGGGRRRKE